MNIRNAYDLLQVMAETFTYGMYDKKKKRCLTGGDFEKIIGTEEMYNDCIVMKPSEVWKEKIAGCWDATLLEYSELKKLGYKWLKPIYLEVANAANYVVTTHSLLLYKENNTPGFYWFEWAWYHSIGIHGPYNMESEVVKIIQEQIPEDDKQRISYWNEEYDIEKLLKMGEISVKDYIGLVHPNA